MKEKNPYILKLISRMNLDQKVGAMLTLGFSGIVPKHNIFDYINKFQCGGLRLSPEFRIFGNYIDPNSGKTVVNLGNITGIKYGDFPPSATASEYKSVLDSLQTMARKRPLSIPLHFSFDQEGGSSSDFCFGGVNIFTKPMGIRATDDSKMAYEVALAVSKQSKAVGFNWIHSPVLDINSDSRNPEIYTRAYSDRVEEVVEYSTESCKGFKDEKMIATGKHFPGRGHSNVDAHFKVPVIEVDKITMLERELLPYKELIKQDLLPSIMLAHSIFPAIDADNIATVSEKVIKGLLREELGFEGVITTDSMTMGGIATRYGVANACALALEAGADLILMKAENHLVEETFNTIKQFVMESRISQQDLDAKVYRILNLKYEYGLFHQSNDDIVKAEDILNDPSIRSLSKQVARRSVLIARDRKNWMPIGTNDKVLIIEQKIKHYNNASWHSGLLYENCLRYSRNISYLETAYSYDKEDELNIKSCINNFDVVVITNYFLRGNRANKEYIESIIKECSQKVIVITNTPYEEISVPVNADSVLVTFATSPDNIEVSAGVLFGEIAPEGIWPINYKLPDVYN